MGTQIAMMKIYHCQVKQSTPQWKIFWCVIHIRVRGILGGEVRKCDRLYEWSCRSEYQILVVEKRPYMGTQIAMMKYIIVKSSSQPPMENFLVRNTY
ncbi:hypothetical protein [Cylindrospermopsis raciborskii]|uniref:hypothetical protein n=1 Tax=Cylindrospermopsis raciborskii TaxID=77022 RepID=UPI00114369CD|nr:hypothetical protein [Cylindrospermopsis raciborskii]TPX26989.1 hypothetical protein FIV49_11945 [Cylindrospermopsis raciborskii GIHE 2018]